MATTTDNITGNESQWGSAAESNDMRQQAGGGGSQWGVPWPDHGIEQLFGIPLYRAIRNSSLNPTEEAELEDIIKKQEQRVDREPASNNSFSQDTYILETKFANLKEFCEKHIRIYAKEVLGVTDEGLTFYITQSWLNYTKPGEIHHLHCHQNSILSGVFYVSVEDNDAISLLDPLRDKKNNFFIRHDIQYAWNADTYQIDVTKNELILFPSWLEHGINANPNATKDRISLAFNVFVKGKIGESERLNELIL